MATLALLLESTEPIALPTAAQLLPSALPALTAFATADDAARVALIPGGAADWQPVKALLEARLLYDVQQHADALGKLEAALATCGGNVQASPSVGLCLPLPPALFLCRSAVTNVEVALPRCHLKRLLLGGI